MFLLAGVVLHLLISIFGSVLLTVGAIVDHHVGTRIASRRTQYMAVLRLIYCPFRPGKRAEMSTNTYQNRKLALWARQMWNIVILLSAAVNNRINHGEKPLHIQMRRERKGEREREENKAISPSSLRPKIHPDVPLAGCTCPSYFHCLLS